VKTVVPDEAHAKITCRLVPDQDPDKVIETLKAHVERNTPPGVTVAVQAAPGRAKPYFIAPEHWGNRAAGAVLTELYGRLPYLTRVGGSVPACEIFLSGLRAYTVGFGFALQDENLHAPDEFFRLSSFERAVRGRGRCCWSGWESTILPEQNTATTLAAAVGDWRQPTFIDR
jgi:acetylornithine deacetylase/succinyl-diaminopimelate desuccinylase-like protein